MKKVIDFTDYYGTYYAEVKTEDGTIKTYERISAKSPIEVARQFKKDAKPCKKEKSIIFVVSNKWRFNEKVKNNYYN